MKFILGKKIGMTRVFKEDGKMVPVTLVESGACVITQIKTEEKDGYRAIQVGFGETKKISKPRQGHIKKAQEVLGKENEKETQVRYLREFRIEGDKEYKIGEKLDIADFVEGDKVKVIAISKGKGFQGGMKRHGFKGQPASHGTKHAARQPGSIGSGFPEHVFKGKRMAGRMGGDQVTSETLEIVRIDKEKNILAIKGSFAGNKGALVQVKTI